MTKQLSIMPIQSEDVKYLIELEGNTKKVFVELVNTFAKNYRIEYPRMSRSYCSLRGYEVVMNTYKDLNIEIPL